MARAIASTSQSKRILRGVGLFLSMLLLPALACSSVQPPASTPVIVTVLVTAATQVVDAESSPTSAPTTTLSPTAGPGCTVQQSVNLRTGPGTAYDPPIDTLQPGTELTPTGFNPQGVPGGSWVQVEVKGRNENGWINSSSQYVTCTTELASLPAVTASPPPKPQRPVVSAGTPDGDNQDNFRTSLDFNPDYFLRMYVFYSEDPNENFKPKKDGRDIASVEFTVTSADGGKTYYDRTEKNPGYCIFGGGEPDCTPWIVEGGQYKWKQGGEPVKSGKYGLTITVTASNGDEGSWLWNSNSGNPIKIDVP
jgi:hypothetical protein